MIINAENLILGRLASKAAKLLLKGNKIDIVNSEKALISGNKVQILNRYKSRVSRGIPLKGPYFPRMPDRIVKRTIRGMLPYKIQKGRKALSNLKCYIGVPDEFKDKKFETIPNADISKLPNYKYVDVLTISKELGAKI